MKARSGVSAVGFAGLAGLAAASLAGAAEITAGDLALLAGHDVVFLGEVHDNAVHHANQALAVALLQPRALVFEMLTPEQAARITPDLRGDAVALGAALGWEASGWPDFAMYSPIFAAAPGAAVFGGDVPRRAIQQSIEQGAAAAFGAGAGNFGLQTALTGPDQARREAEQAEAHCGALPVAILPGMVEAQRLRDAVLARAVVAALDRTPGPVVVITGNGHARTDRGAAAMLAAAATWLDVVSVGQLEADPGSGAPFDLWIVTDPAPRDDPCARFTSE